MENESRIRILLADDHPVVLEGLTAMIERQPDMIVVGTACNGKIAIDAYRLLQPDVTLMDLRMPECNGAEAIVEIRNQFPNAQLIVLTIGSTEEDVFRCISAGAKAFLLKDAPRQQLLETIRRVAAGEMVISDDIAVKLAARINDPELTRRENEVLQLIADGNSNREVGIALFISEGTVKSHVNSILSKMRVTDRTQAVVKAIQLGRVVLKDKSEFGA